MVNVSNTPSRPRGPPPAGLPPCPWLSVCELAWARCAGATRAGEARPWPVAPRTGPGKRGRDGVDRPVVGAVGDAPTATVVEPAPTPAPAPAPVPVPVPGMTRVRARNGDTSGGGGNAAPLPLLLLVRCVVGLVAAAVVGDLTSDEEVLVDEGEGGGGRARAARAARAMAELVLAYDSDSDKDKPAPAEVEEDEDEEASRTACAACAAATAAAKGDVGNEADTDKGKGGNGRDDADDNNPERSALSREVATAEVVDVRRLSFAGFGLTWTYTTVSGSMSSRKRGVAARTPRSCTPQYSLLAVAASVHALTRLIMP